jgi:hypothetical protein
MMAIFGRSRRALTEQIEQLRAEIAQLRGYMGAQVQHLAAEVAPVTEEIAATRLRRFLAAMHRVAHLQIEQGAPAAKAIAEAVQSVTRPLPYGVAGGRARARHAWRYDDGTFMSYDDEEQIQIEARERMARGGRARARIAKRAPDGTFL